MKSLYVSQSQGRVSLRREFLQVWLKDELAAEVPLPHLEQVLIFGQAQVTTQAIRACLQRRIPILFLSRLGYCYGRLLAIEQGYRALSRYQQALTLEERLTVARIMVQAKIKNSRVILQRQQRRLEANFTSSLQLLDYLGEQARRGESLAKLNGYEGAAANAYFSALGQCFSSPDFVFIARSRRPPGNPVNALLSFGYQVLWNHLLSLIEFQGLDPYQGCLHESSDRHAALTSDLLEEFRAPIVDSLVLYLVNNGMMAPAEHFEYRDGGCFLNGAGRRLFLQVFLQRMEETLGAEDGSQQPRWHLLLRQVKRFKAFVYHPSQGYQPYLIR